MTEYLPKPDYAFINVGKEIKIGPWLVNKWQPDNILNRFVSTTERITIEFSFWMLV